MIAKLLGGCVISFIAVSALAADAPKEVVCGEIVINSRFATPQVVGKVVLRTVKGHLQPVFVFPNRREATFDVLPNSMHYDQLWKMVEACKEGQPSVKDVRP